MRKPEQHSPHDPAESINGRLVMNLRDISHTMRSLYEGRGSQRWVLIVLNETGTITQRELTQRLGIQPGSASEVIAKLESAGLVERTASQADRRTADIALTQEGKRQAEAALEQRWQRHEGMFAVLSDEEKAQLLALLEKINSDWRERYMDNQGHREGRHGHHHGHGHGRDSEHRTDFDGRHRGGVPAEEEGHEFRREAGPSGGRGCDHDCEHCPHPCGRGRYRGAQDR